jgi:tRNA-splicing ligase RtcB (3'-phosphate/5'-hydroxy nucleic acid ligase)
VPRLACCVLTGTLPYAMPVGGVIAYEEHISVSGVGFDIGCGNMAVRLDTPYAAIKDHVGTILADVQSNVRFGVGRKNDEPVEHALFDNPRWLTIPEITPLRSMAQAQRGTVGSGNHYVDLFEDENGFVWIGVHFGSRGFGHKTATAFLKAGGGVDGMEVDPCVLHEGSDPGRQVRLRDDARWRVRLRRPRVGRREGGENRRR